MPSFAHPSLVRVELRRASSVKRKVAWIVAVAGLLALSVAAACALVNMALGHQPMPSFASNRHRSSRGIDELQGKYRVGVLGDAQKGLANLANIVRAVKAEGVDFMIQTGDLASTNDEGHYRLAALMLERADPRVRLWVVPGNHDIKGGAERFV